jgi:hypothetical protein
MNYQKLHLSNPNVSNGGFVASYGNVQLVLIAMTPASSSMSLT